MRQTHLSSTSRTNHTSALADSWARLISDAANPLFLPSFTIISLALIREIAPATTGWIASIALLFFTIIPLCITLYLLQTRQIRSLDIPDRKNRTKLFGYSILSSSAGSFIIAILCIDSHTYLSIIAFTYLLNPILGYLINRAFKISIHTAAIAMAGTIFLTGYYLVPLYDHIISLILSLSMLLVLLPLMIWSRFYLRIHSVAELLAGVLAGIVLTFVEIGIMLTFW